MYTEFKGKYLVLLLKEEQAFLISIVINLISYDELQRSNGPLFVAGSHSGHGLRYSCPNRVPYLLFGSSGEMGYLG